MRQLDAFKTVRHQTVTVLLSTSLILGLALILSLAGLVLDDGKSAPVWLSAGMAACALTSVLGLLIGGLSLAVLLRAISDD